MDPWPFLFPRTTGRLRKLHYILYNTQNTTSWAYFVQYIISTTLTEWRETVKRTRKQKKDGAFWKILAIRQALEKAKTQREGEKTDATETAGVQN